VVRPGKRKTQPPMCNKQTAKTNNKKGVGRWAVGQGVVFLVFGVLCFVGFLTLPLTATQLVFIALSAN